MVCSLFRKQGMAQGLPLATTFSLYSPEICYFEFTYEVWLNFGLSTTYLGLFSKDPPIYPNTHTKCDQNHPI